MTYRVTLPRSIRTIAIVALIAGAAALSAAGGHAQSTPGQGPGGPVLVGAVELVEAGDTGPDDQDVDLDRCGVCCHRRRY